MRTSTSKIAKKAVSLHGPLIGSLKGSGRMDSENFKKMSKSDPDSGILVSDSPDEIRRKIGQAFCPVGQSKGNPVIDIAKYVLLPRMKGIFIGRPDYFNMTIQAECPEAIYH